jgi:hypothetical protein
MTTTPQPQNEPTLMEIVERLQGLNEQLKDIKTEQARFDERCTTYQKATQWVVQLAFTLIAAATITVILTAVLR